MVWWNTHINCNLHESQLLMKHYDNSPIYRRITNLEQKQFEDIELQSVIINSIFEKFDHDTKMVKLKDRYVKSILEGAEDYNLANYLNETAQVHVVQVSNINLDYIHSVVGELIVRWVDFYLELARRAEK